MTQHGTEPQIRHGLLADIKLLGGLLDDLERLRIQHENRVGAAQRDGINLPPYIDISSAGLRKLEHEAKLELVRLWRRHPLAPWAKTIHGVGETSIARLISIIGDPADREMPSQLWAYCGVGDPDRKRGKAKTQEDLFACGNKYARKQLFVITESFVKVKDGPYRTIYDERRSVTADRVHAKPCQQCAGKGKDPASVIGEPWRDGHKMRDAMRIAGKTFLLDLWVAAGGPKRWDHPTAETQRMPVPEAAIA